MNEILDLVQTTLDTLLITETSKVYSYWGRRAEIDNDRSTEYVVYSIEDDFAEVSADGGLIYRMMSVTLQYYVKFANARTYAGRQNTMTRMDAIREAMRTVGFGCQSGWSEIGDVDDVGFATFQSTYVIPRLMTEGE